MTSTQLTRAEEAYAHLASFQRVDVVDLAGEEFFQPGTVDLAQQHDGDDITAAYVLVRGCGALTSTALDSSRTTGGVSSRAGSTSDGSSTTSTACGPTSASGSGNSTADSRSTS